MEENKLVTPKKRLQMWKFMNIFEKALCGHFLLPVVLIDKKASNFLQKNGLEGLITTALHRGGETNVRTFSLYGQRFPSKNDLSF